MAAILNSLNAHNLPIFQPILIVLVSKFMVHEISIRTCNYGSTQVNFKGHCIFSPEK